jgi:hypothetical protein
MMTALDRLIPTPRLVEIDRVDVNAPLRAAWNRIRHANLADSPAIRALFAIRSFVERAADRQRTRVALHVDDLVSTPGHPGFQILLEDSHEVAVGAIGQVWRLVIPFVHVAGPQQFAAFREPGFVKVAWALRALQTGTGTRIEVEVRVDATDDESWRKFRRYFRIIGIGSHFIRRSALRSAARDLRARCGSSSDSEDRPPD